MYVQHFPLMNNNLIFKIIYLVNGEIPSRNDSFH